jgi:ubiquinone/menaquinone biosynthesis C-methylase UbiE
MEHIEDPSLILEESHRVLKKGGNYVIGVPTIACYKAYADREIFYIQKLENTFKEFDFKQKKYFYTPFKSDYLEKNMRAHCHYAIFQN